MSNPVTDVYRKNRQVPDGVAFLHKRKLFQRFVIQIAIVLLMTSIVGLFFYQVHNGLAKHGVAFSFGYLTSPAGVQITEGGTISFFDGWPSFIDFSPSLSNFQAYLAGFFNTLKIALFAIFVSTVLGTALGIGKLSRNWLLGKVCFVIVEFVRNTPLLIQLTFWYFAVILKLPPISVAAGYFSDVIVSQQGIYLPSVGLAENLSVGAGLGFLLLLNGLGGIFFGRHHLKRIYFGFCLVLGVLLLIYFGSPFDVSFPKATRFNASGGLHISPEMTALIFAVGINGAAYVAEIIRGGLEAVPKGQWEASASLGLGKFHNFKDVILPQVFRIILPSVGNQYISLAKNTSIAAAIGFPDLFNITGTVANQSGRTLEGLVLMVGAYLMMSWSISVLVNLANNLLRRGQVRGVK